jgi:hypothetical protein
MQILSKNPPLFHNKHYFYQRDILIEVVSENDLHFVFLRMATMSLDISLKIEIRTSRTVGVPIVQVSAMNAARFSLFFFLYKSSNVLNRILLQRLDVLKLIRAASSAEILVRNSSGLCTRES